MVESQSRYSIVERLTSSKLDIITAKSQLDNDIVMKKQTVEEAEADLKDWEKNIQSEVAKEKQDKKRHIEKLKTMAKNTADRKQIKSKTYDEKIAAIDNALVQIQKISETAPNPAS